MIRGLLASEYVRREADILADVTDLAEWWDDVNLRTLVDELIRAKREGESLTTSSRLALKADDWITQRLDEGDPSGDVDKTWYRDQLDDWMLNVRT